MLGMEQSSIDGLQAAASVLLARGSANVRAEELARAARVSVGTLYRRHGDKAGFVAAVRALAEEDLSRVASQAWRISWDPARAAASDYRTAFLTLWHALGRWAVEQPALFGFAFLHPDPQSATSDGIGAQPVLELLSEVLEAGRALQATRTAPTWVLAGLVWGTLLELVRTAHGRGSDLEDEALVAAGEAVWCALRAPRRAADVLAPAVMAGASVTPDPGAAGNAAAPAFETPGPASAEDAAVPACETSGPAAVDVAAAPACETRGPGTAGAAAAPAPETSSSHLRAPGLGVGAPEGVRAAAGTVPAALSATVRLGEAPAERAGALAAWRPCCPCSPWLKPQTHLRMQGLPPEVPAFPGSDLAPPPVSGDDAPAREEPEAPMDPARAAALAYHANWKWGTRPEPSVIIGHMAALGFDADCEADVQRAFAEVDRGALDFDFVNRWCISQVHVQRDREYERVRQLHEASGGQLSWGEALARVRASGTAGPARGPSGATDLPDSCPIPASGDAADPTASEAADRTASHREASGLGTAAEGKGSATAPSDTGSAAPKAATRCAGSET